MPIKDSEKRRAYDRERKRRTRARQKQAEIEEQIKRGNINYGLKAKREQFMSHEEYKRHFPNASFPLYLKEKIEFEKENRVRNVPKISREDAFKITGVDLWHGSEGKQEAIDAEMREGDRLQAILDSPAHEPRETGHTDWEAEVSQQVEDFKASQVEKQQQEQLEQEQAHELEDKILGRRKQEDSEEKQENS